MSYLDSQIARIVDELERSGRLEDTLIVLTADHGEFLGDYGSFGKRSFLDRAARVPLICAGPGFGSKRTRNVVSLIDLYPTFVEAAGLEPVHVDGISLLNAQPGRIVFGQYQQGEMGLFAVITEFWKYIWSAPDRREYLIDRQADPEETRNLAYNFRVRATLVELRELAQNHFDDLSEVDLDDESNNVSLRLGDPPDEDGLRSLRAIGVDPDASTLVVRGGAWDSPPDGYYN